MSGFKTKLLRSMCEVWVTRKLLLDLTLPMNHLSFKSVELAVSDEAHNLYSRYLSAGEFARSQRFGTPQLARRFRVARGALRIVLGEQLQMDPASLDFESGAFGKPYLADKHCGKEVFFNLSHSGDHALIGVGEVELGVDIEKVVELPNLYRIATSIMPDRELNELENLLPEARRDFFYRIWVAKEACVKQTGEGMARDPREIMVCRKEGLAVATCGHKKWNLIELPFEPGYMACLATTASIDGYNMSRFLGPR